MSFADDFKASSDAAVREHANGTMRRAAKRFGEVLVERTPEDKGNAKGNWVASKRARRSGTDEGADAASQRPSNEAAIDATDFFAGDSIVWSNAAPYANKLEHGWSDQAPNGMLAVTSAEWPGILRESDAPAAEARGEGRGE